MQFTRFIITIFFVISVLSLSAQKKDTLTLQQCLEAAVKNNLNVKQTGLIMEQDRINFKQAKDNLLPNINAGYNHNIANGRSLTISGTYANQSSNYDNYNLSGNLILFNGLALQNAIRQASLSYQAGKMDYQQAKDVVTINVITAYLAILDNEELLSQSINQLDVAQKTVERSEVLDKNGANKSPADLYNLRGTLASSRVTLVNAQNAVEQSRISLYQIMNIPYNRGIELQQLNAQELQGEHGVSPDQVYANALAQLPVVKAAVLRRESAEKAISVAKGYLYPTIYLSSGLATTYSSAVQRSVFTDSTTAPLQGVFVNTPAGKQAVNATTANFNNQNISYFSQFKNNYGTLFALGVNIPILNGLQKRNAVATAKINLLESRNIEDNTKLQLQQNVEQAYANMESAYRRYQALVDQVNAYKESFRIAQIQFDAGILTSVDFVTTKNFLDAANLSLISAKYDYYIDSKVLDYYQGKLAF